MFSFTIAIPMSHPAYFTSLNKVTVDVAAFRFYCALAPLLLLWLLQVAYVLGQLSHAASIEALKQRILDTAEHEMVRHEAAGEPC